MLTNDTEFRRGDSVTILIKNRPFVDFLVPPDLNDYRDCDFTSIKIYDPNDELVVNSVLLKIDTEPGWYYYRYQTDCNSPLGLYKVVVELQTAVDVGEPTQPVTPCTTGSSGTSGTSGTDLSAITIPSSGEGEEIVSDVQMRQFRISSEEVF